MSCRSRSTAPRCIRCRAHLERCICEHLPSLELKTRVVLVMHCRELKKTTATGPLALACLKNGNTLIHGERDSQVELAPEYALSEQTLLLYPGEGAIPLNQLPAELRSKKLSLIVPDGNWRQAARAARRLPGIDAAIPVTLPEAGPTEWGLREETKLGGLSTFEAIARALGHLEGSEVEERLMTVFRLAVDAAWEARGGPPGRPQDKPEAPESLEDLELLYEDETAVVVNKPSSITVHRGWAQDGVPLLQRVRDQVGCFVFPVHRLDRATSGALLFAKSSEAARAYSEQFARGTVKKRYLALCRGHDPSLGRVEHALSQEQGPAQDAVTEFEYLAHYERYGLYFALPETGRLHQIRRHLKHVSHPIIGDVRYGKGEHNRHFRETYGFARLALHAAELEFDSPVSTVTARDSKRVRVRARLEPQFASLLEQLGLSSALRVRGYGELLEVGAGAPSGLR